PGIGGQILLVLDEHEQLSEVGGAIAEGRYAVIEVGDNGKGMEGEVLRRAFDPYFTTRAEGTGLGLPIVQAAVLAMDGHLSLDSQPGRGTTVHLYLPLANC